MSKRKILAALAAAGLVAAGSSALTNTITGYPTEPLGYVDTTISGAAITGVDYNLDATATNLDSITLTLQGNLVTSHAWIGFNGGSVVECAFPGTFDTDHTTFTCQNGLSAYVQDPEDVTSVQVVVN